MDKKRTVVIGVGNLLFGDEGIGIHAVNELKKEALPPEVEVIDGGAAGLDLIFMLEGAARAIIIDCTEAEAEPGTIFRIPVTDLALNAPSRAVSLHDISLVEALALAGKLGKLPPTVIYGVQPGKVTCSTELSEPVKKNLPRLLSLIRQEMAVLY
ncbi:MAG: hydrogenase maturation protease [Pelotomaculum sp.]|nr:hydrogenase maturation protease [Pelotomaculum sp.]